MVEFETNVGIITGRLTYTNWLLSSVHGLSYDYFIHRTNRFKINFRFMIKGKAVKTEKNETPQEGYSGSSGGLSTDNDWH